MKSVKFKNEDEFETSNISINTINEVEHLTIFFAKDTINFEALKDIYLEPEYLNEITIIERIDNEAELINLLTGFIEPVRLVYENNRFEMTVRKLRIEEILIRDLLKNKTY